LFERLRKLAGASDKGQADGLLPDPLAERIIADAAGTSADKASTARSAKDVLDQVRNRVEKAEFTAENADACLKKVTYRDPVPKSTVLDALRTYGLAIFPEIYDAGRLARIAAEYEDMIANGSELTRNVSAREDTPAHSYAITVKRDALPTPRFPETQSLFASPIVEQITRDYFAGQRFDFNTDLFVQWTDHTDVPASGTLHWDKQLTLKSWLYVTDATEGYGAMRAGAGTAAWTRYIREDAMFEGIPYGQIDNSVEEDGLPIVTTGGPAGTFFLFVTDTAHGATPVAPGKRRNIIRARSRPVRVHEWQSWAGTL